MRLSALNELRNKGIFCSVREYNGAREKRNSRGAINRATESVHIVSNWPSSRMIRTGSVLLLILGVFRSISVAWSVRLDAAKTTLMHELFLMETPCISWWILMETPGTSWLLSGDARYFVATQWRRLVVQEKSIIFYFYTFVVRVFLKKCVSIW